MYATISAILLFTWFVGLSNNLIGSYAIIFLIGAVFALLAHLLGREDEPQTINKKVSLAKESFVRKLPNLVLSNIKETVNFSVTSATAVFQRYFRGYKGRH